MFDNLNDVEVKETVNYLPAGIHEVKVIEMKTSEQREGYTGIPYTEYKVSNSKGIAYVKLSGRDSSTSDVAVRVRKEIFKGFLQASGATSFDNIPLACKEALGKTINVCLGEREYWTNDKDTGAPVVKKVVEYKFANREGKSIQWADKYNRTLSASDQAAYQAAHEAFIGSNSSVATDSMPF